eukprot:1744652-Pyramimonas_sp.AAC.1
MAVHKSNADRWVELWKETQAREGQFSYIKVKSRLSESEIGISISETHWYANAEAGTRAEEAAKDAAPNVALVFQ